MEITFAHLSDYALVSKEGKLSVLGIFSRITPPTLPYIHPSCYLSFEVELNYAETGRPFRARIEMVDADGANVFTIDSEFNYTGPAKIGDHPRIVQTLGINGLKLTRAGGYDVNLFLNDQLKAQVGLVVAPRDAGAGGPELPLG